MRAETRPAVRPVPAPGGGEGAAVWPNSPETQDLLDKARRGEAGAVDQLLTAHREPLRRMIGMRLDPALAARVDASDVVQDVLLEAHKRLQDYLRNPAMLDSRYGSPPAGGGRI